MKSSKLMRAAGAALIVGGGLAVAGVAGASSWQRSSHALFVLTDSAQGDSVTSYLRAPDGTIANAHTYATGGLGATAAGASADPLASQDGLALADGGNTLLAVNAGSDTVSVFSVDGTRLRVTQQISSGGLFPDSIAVSGNLVAVLNGGGAGAVSEFRLDGGYLRALPGQTRSLGLSNTTPPNFVMGAGQVGYTPDGNHLVITTKHSTDSFEVFGVGRDGQLSATPVVTAAQNPVPFAFNFDAAGNLVAVEAGTSSLSTYRVNADGSLSAIGTVSDGQKALCWVSTAQGYFFGDNAGSASISSFAEGAGAVPQLLNATAASAHAGTTDSTVSPNGDYLYVESGGAGTIDSFRVNADGSLTPMETLFTLPASSEGIVAS